MDNAYKGSLYYGACRCCQASGMHRDIMREYYWNGVREVYFDAFLEVFNLFLSSNANLSTLICASCVQKLRDASMFRAMVVSTERQLLGEADEKHMIFMNETTDDDGNTRVVKAEVKIEPHEVVAVDYEPDYEHNDDNNDAGSPVCGGVSGEVTATPVDKHWSLVLDEQALLARGPAPPLPTQTDLFGLCPGFARRLNEMTRERKLMTGSMVEKLLEDQEKNRRARCVFVTEKMAHITNACVILNNSNATPFKSKNRTGFPCFYCRKICEDLAVLREHRATEHPNGDVRKALNCYGAESLATYIDVTDLQCTICNEDMPSLVELKAHLTKEHKKKIYTQFSDRVVPFKLSDTNVYQCQICGFNFETFGAMERHMNVHYRNYVCKECGSGFLTKYRLKVHVRSMHVSGSHPCDTCKKVFNTMQKYKNHVDAVHRNIKRFKCTHCSERFTEYFTRQKHMVSAHGVAPLQYKCNVCARVYERRYALSRHLKRDHLEEREHACSSCSYTCFTRAELRVHEVRHTGERVFQCEVCHKAYARKKTLREHMRIHNNDRRFACAVCGQAFVQKCSLKGHIKTHHLEYNMPI